MLNGSLAVRYPEKNQVALQQLTLADRERFEMCVLADIDNDTRMLLARLKRQKYIEGYEYRGEGPDREAMVYMNGNLVKLTSFASKSTNQTKKKGVSRFTDRLMKQTEKSTYETIRNANRSLYESIENQSVEHVIRDIEVKSQKNTIDSNTISESHGERFRMTAANSNVFSSNQNTHLNRGLATNSGTSNVFNFVNTFNGNANLNTSDEFS